MLRNLLAMVLITIIATPAMSDETEELIVFLNDELQDIRENIKAKNAAPQSGGFLEKDKADYQEDIDAIMDKALGLVVPDTFEMWSEQLAKIQEARKEAEAKRDALRFQQKFAKTSEGVGLLGTILGREFETGSVEDIETKLAALDAALVQLGQDQDMVFAGFAQDMQDRYGFILTDTQVKAMLYSVNGALMIEKVAVTGALVEIERLLADDKAADATRQRYISIASATRLIHVRMLQQHLVLYNSKWLPRLADYRRETQTLLEKTRRAINVSKEDNRQIYANNFATQERILFVIDQYSAMLERRQRLTEETLDDAYERAEAAINTLMTYELAANLSSVISESTAHYEAVMSLEFPELEKLQLEDFDEMRDISRFIGS